VSLDEDRLRVFDGEIVTQGFEEVFFIDDQIGRVGSALLLRQDGIAFLVSPLLRYSVDTEGNVKQKEEPLTARS
jgi:hypothetical protein